MIIRDQAFVNTKIAKNYELSRSGPECRQNTALTFSRKGWPDIRLSWPDHDTGEIMQYYFPERVAGYPAIIVRSGYRRNNAILLPGKGALRGQISGGKGDLQVKPAGIGIKIDHLAGKIEVLHKF